MSECAAYQDGKTHREIRFFLLVGAPTPFSLGAGRLWVFGDLGLRGRFRHHGMPALRGIFAAKAGCSAVTEPMGPGNDRPAEKRKVDSSILSLTTTDRHGWQPAAPAFRLFRRRFRLYFSMSAGVCRGMSSCPWDICGAARRCGLVGFLWGSREVSGGSGSWAYSAPWCHGSELDMRGGRADCADRMSSGTEAAQVGVGYLPGLEAAHDHVRLQQRITEP